MSITPLSPLSQLSLRQPKQVTFQGLSPEGKYTHEVFLQLPEGRINAGEAEIDPRQQDYWQTYGELVEKAHNRFKALAAAADEFPLLFFNKSYEILSGFRDAVAEAMEEPFFQRIKEGKPLSGGAEDHKAADDLRDMINAYGHASTAVLHKLATLDKRDVPLGDPLALDLTEVSERLRPVVSAHLEAMHQLEEIAITTESGTEVIERKVIQIQHAASRQATANVNSFMDDFEAQEPQA